MILSDFIWADTAVARSVNLERDMGDGGTLRQYHLTDKGLEIISRLVSALNGERISAWSLTGPFGMGKSSFANFLLTLCGPSKEEETHASRRMLMEKDPSLGRELEDVFANHTSQSKGFFCVPITSSFEPLNRSLLNGLLRAAGRIMRKPGRTKKTLKELIVKLNRLADREFLETTALVKLFKEAGKIYGAPVAVVIDEFGKNLEFMARHPAQGDLYILQALAESDDIYLWVCLHQAFDEYASGLTSKQLQEWGKIQGRFEDIPFIESKRQMIGFIAETLTRKNSNSVLDEAIGKWAKAFSHKKNSAGLPELKQWNLENIERLYPLHPLAALILPELSIRFAQNDRTLFAFLCSGEPNALPAFLSAHEIEPKAGHLITYGPELLYDYFLSSTTQALLNRPESHRWIEIRDFIERSRNLSPFHQDVLKVIGLLNLISGPSGFRASDKMMYFAFLRPFDSAPVDQRKIKKALRELQDSGILIYREYADEYRLWEGTDFDIVSALQETKSLMAAQPLDEVLERTLPLTPLIAARHSYRTGTLRQFERRWCSHERLSEKVPSCSTDDIDGLVLFCFGKEQELDNVPANTEDGRPIIVAYANCEEQISEMILEAAANKAILKESPELARDGVARKEAKFRAQVAEERLRRFLSKVFAPENPEVSWWGLNRIQEMKSHRDLAQLLSRVCDEAYCDSPVIRNELVNRNRLSSATAKARRELIEAMLNHESQENLGMQGIGPEVAIYRTMLRAEGLHRVNEDGQWQFSSPPSESSYFKAWTALIEIVKEATDEALPITCMIELLRRPPFGIKEGPIPILLALFFTIKSDEIALYQQGAFVPFLGSEEMELMAKRPEFFSLKKFAPAGVQARIFQVYRDLLNTFLVPQERQVRNVTMLSVVGPLVNFANTLSTYARRTRSLTQEAQKVRRALLQAREPIRLLFTELPEAVGLPQFDKDKPISNGAVQEFQIRLRSCLVELADAYNRLLQKIQVVISETFGGGPDLRELRSELKDRVNPLISRCGDKELRPLISALAKTTGSDKDWVVSIGTVVAQRPVDSWRDRDLQVFSARMHDFARRFAAFEAIVAAEKSPLRRKRNREPRLVSLTWLGGNTSSEVFWLGKSQSKRLQKTVDSLKNELSSTELKGLFVLLGDHLLKGVNSDKDNTHNE